MKVCKREILGFIVMLLFTLVFVSTVFSKQSSSCFFYNSLHHTGIGMKNGYDEGFKKVLKIPYEKLGCEHCHVKTCDTCHAEKTHSGYKYTLKTAKNPKTCLKCHARAYLTMVMAKKLGLKDVHFSKGMVCTDCHKGKDVHGNGVLPKSMMEEGAIQIRCETCHDPDPRIPEHTVHHGKLGCTACHVATSVACVNCHFERFMKTHKKRGNFIPTASWLLLVNYKGKVVAGTAMSIVYKGKAYLTYAPYFTHIVMKKGRTCRDCHANKAVKLIASGKGVPIIKMEGSRITFWRGVIPLTKKGVRWEFFDKKCGRWVKMEKVKLSGVHWWYAKPLTSSQLKALEQVEEGCKLRP